MSKIYRQGDSVIDLLKELQLLEKNMNFFQIKD